MVWLAFEQKSPPKKGDLYKKKGTEAKKVLIQPGLQFLLYAIWRDKIYY